MYSKYEHLGVLTNLIQKENVEAIITRQLKSISLILHGIVIATSNIKELFNEIKINSESEIQEMFTLYVKMMGEMGIK